MSFLRKRHTSRTASDQPGKFPDASRRTRHSRKRNRRLVWLLLALLLLLGAYGVERWIVPAWRATALRESYVPQIEAMLRQDPYNPRLLSTLGARLAQFGYYEHAADVLQKAVAAGDNDDYVWLTWAAAEAAAGKQQQAHAVLNFGRHRRIPGVLNAKIRIRHLGKHPTNDELAQAICPFGSFQLLVRLTGGSFLNRLWEFWGHLRPESSGFATREKWAKNDPNNAEAQRLWGEGVAINGDYALAAKVLQHALQLAPHSPKTHLAMANVLMAEGQEGPAGVEYAIASRIRKNWFPADLGLGKVAVDQKIIPVAVSSFESAVKDNPRSAEAWIGLGRACYLDRFKLQRSVDAFNQAHRLDPTRTDYFVDYADALRAVYKLDQAESLLRSRVKAVPSDAHAHFILAKVLLDNRPSPERTREAESELRTSLRWAPHVPAGEALLAKLLVEDNQPDQAIPLLMDALQGDRYNIQAATTLVRAFERSGHPALAQKAAQSAVRLARYEQQVALLEDQEHRWPMSIPTHRKLADLYASGGQIADAQREAQMAQFLQARPKEAGRAIQILQTQTSLSVGASDATRAADFRTPGH